MRTIARILAVVAALGCLSLWLAAGANRGWTKTSVPVTQLDEVTGLEAVTYERRLVPGVDFLGAGLLLAGAFAGLSFLIRNQTKHPNIT